MPWGSCQLGAGACVEGPETAFWQPGHTPQFRLFSLSLQQVSVTGQQSVSKGVREGFAFHGRSRPLNRRTHAKAGMITMLNSRIRWASWRRGLSLEGSVVARAGERAGIPGGGNSKSKGHQEAECG